MSFALYVKRRDVADQLARNIDRALRDSDAVIPRAGDSRHPTIVLDPHVMRCIPIVGVKGGLGGVIPGTKPGEGGIFR